MVKRGLAIAAVLGALAYWFIGRAEQGPEGEPGDSNGETASGSEEAVDPVGPKLPPWLARSGVGPVIVAGVVRSGTAPVEGAVVTAVVADFPEAEPRTVRTGADGRFSFGPLSPVHWWLSASADDLGLAAMSVDLRNPISAWPPDDLVVDLPGCEHKLRGVVSDTSGKPLAAARIQLTSNLTQRMLEESSFYSTPVLSDAQGAYELCTAKGRRGILVSADGYGAVVRRLTVSGVLKRDFHLLPEGLIRGRVQLRGGGAIGGAARVRAEIFGGKYRPVTGGESLTPAGAVALVGDHGGFEIRGLAAGTFGLSAQGGRVALRDPVTVQVSAGAVTERILEVDVSSQVDGRVTENGAPVAGAHVSLFRRQGRKSSESVSTDREGRFSLRWGPVGSVLPRVDGFRELEPKTIEVPSATAVNLRVGTPLSGLVRGVVRRGAQVVPSAEVWAVYENGGRMVVAASGPDGRFEAKLSNSAALFASSTRAGSFSSAVPVTVKTGEVLEGVELLLDHGARVRGRIVNERLEGVEGLRVELSLGGAKDIGTAHTDSNGRFEADSMTGGGAYGLSILDPLSGVELSPLNTPSEVSLADGDSESDLGEIRVSHRTWSIRGVVVDEAGAPVPGTWLRAVPMGDEHVRPDLSVGGVSASSGADGRFELTPLAEGDHSVFVRAQGGAEFVTSNVASGDEEVEIVVRSTGSIEGRLMGFASQPGVRVAPLHSEPVNPIQVSVVDGRFTVDGLLPGVYAVSTDGVSEQAAGARVEVQSGAHSTVSLKAAAAKSVAVIVRGGSAVCRASSADGKGAFSPVAVLPGESDGHHQFYLPNGSYSVLCQSGSQEGGAKITVPSEEGHRVVIVLSPK